MFRRNSLLRTIVTVWCMIFLFRAFGWMFGTAFKVAAAVLLGVGACRLITGDCELWRRLKSDAKRIL